MNRANERAPTPFGRALRALKKALGWALVALMTGVVLAAALFLVHSRDLPRFDALTDYRPKLGTKVHASDGALVAEFYHERRTVVARDQIPLLLKQAVIAAEDANFYQHQGIDYLGIVRAAIKNALHLSVREGASTITQQVVKTFLLSSERTLSRKIKEAILATRLEQNLSKDDILYLYLNQIYFGHLRYGVEEAAQFYFARSVQQLSLGEAALLAGIPQSPGRLSPLRSPERAKARQAYVLGQMVKNGFITQAQADAELRRPLALAPEPPEPAGPYYVEEVRRLLVERHGEKAVFEGGLRVIVAMDPALQRAADRAVRDALEEIDRRHGWRAVERDGSGTADKAPPGHDHLPLAEFHRIRPALSKKLGAPIPSRDPARRPRPAWDIAVVRAAIPAAAAGPDEDGADESAAPDTALAGGGRVLVQIRPLVAGETYLAPIVAVDDAKKEAVVDLGSAEGVLPFASMSWARPFDPLKTTPAPRRPSDVVGPGDIVRVRVLSVPGAPGPRVPLALVPVPLVQAALVAIDPTTRHVVAVVGGYDFGRSAFNRATQAERQPGSAFKPFVYLAAIASQKFTAASRVNDAPEVIYDVFARKEWKPRNFEGDVYEGAMSLREALAKSKNTVTVRLIEAVGPDAVVDVAVRAGIGTPLPKGLSVALGAGEVKPLDLANAYATLAALGHRADPLFVLRVTEPAGRVLEEHHAAAEETLPPAACYVTRSLLQSVVDYGTSTRVRELGWPAAAKTGTTSDFRDAWLAGFTPELVAVSWVGFDDHAVLGPNETGARAALPMWVAFMKAAHQDRPRRDFGPPVDGVEVARIDPATGKLAPDAVLGRDEVFLAGTAPREFAPPIGQAEPTHVYFEDLGARR